MQSTAILEMSVSPSITKMAEGPCPHAAMDKIPSWADYDEDVAEGRIKDMDEPLPPRQPSRDPSSPEAESGDEPSMSSSLCTSIALANPALEKLTEMLKASATANQASRLPRCGLNLNAPAFAMRVAPANPEVEATRKEIEQDYKYAQYASQRADRERKGGIQAQIDLIVARAVPRLEQDCIQKSLDHIVAAFEKKKQEERAHLNMLIQGLSHTRRTVVESKSSNPAILLKDPAIIYTELMR
ncbi:hypothetical protein BKA64DRAFT_637920 [Cadophora sp. MPI-SDFR-AT-0126]|nr:hypothetical protein BKA64DRAFT_637920 [Leotiomycetes sp. MPI-SDFR-AT-0126]